MVARSRRCRPTLYQYLGYLFHFSSVIVGPLGFFVDYIECTEGRRALEHRMGMAAGACTPAAPSASDSPSPLQPNGAAPAAGTAGSAAPDVHSAAACDTDTTNHSAHRVRTISEAYKQEATGVVDAERLEMENKRLVWPRFSFCCNISLPKNRMHNFAISLL